jgi:hypothetical protein
VVGARADLFDVGGSTSFAGREAHRVVDGNKDYKPGVGALVSPLNDVHVMGEALHGRLRRLCAREHIYRKGSQTQPAYGIESSKGAAWRC